MNREQKTAVVEEIAGQIQGADAIFAVDPRGLTVAQAAALRVRLRDADARLRVVKNSLSELAADQSGTPALKPMLQGPTALAFIKGDAALAAKALSDAARALNLLEFKGGLLNGTTLTAEDVRSIARLPSRDVLNAQLVGTIAAPLSGLVRGLNALISGIAIQLQAIADQGLVSGTSSSSEAPAASDPPTAPASEDAARVSSGAEADSASPAGPEEAEAAVPRDSAESNDPAPAEIPEPDAAAVREAAEQPVDDPDSEPHDAPLQPNQAKGEDTPQEDN